MAGFSLARIFCCTSKRIKVTAVCFTIAFIAVLLVQYRENATNFTSGILDLVQQWKIIKAKQVDSVKKEWFISLLHTEEKLKVTIKQNNNNVNILDILSTDLNATRFLKARHRLDVIDQKNKYPEVFMYIHDPKDDRYISRNIQRRGMWEPRIATAILAGLKEFPNSGLLDVGANIGFHSFIAPSLGRSVVCIEPLSDNYLRMAKSVLENNFTDLVTIIPGFVSSSTNITLKLDVNKEKHIGASKAVTVSPEDSCAPPLCLKATTLNDIVDLIPFTDVIIKMDIEGLEPEAFKGSDLLFEKKNIKMIVMEWVHVRTVPKDLEYVMEKLTNLGFKPYFPPFPVPGQLNEFDHDLTSLKPIHADPKSLRQGGTFDIIWRR